MAARPGVEPGLTDSESAVLPLHHRAKSVARRLGFEPKLQASRAWVLSIGRPSQSWSCGLDLNQQPPRCERGARNRSSCRTKFDGRGGRNRTGDLLLPKQALYQTKLHPEEIGWPLRIEAERHSDAPAIHRCLRRERLRSVRSSPAAAGHGSSSLEGGGGWWARTTPSFTPGTGFQPAAAQTGRLHPPKFTAKSLRSNPKGIRPRTPYWYQTDSWR